MNVKKMLLIIGIVVVISILPLYLLLNLPKGKLVSLYPVSDEEVILIYHAGKEVKPTKSYIGYMNDKRDLIWHEQFLDWSLASGVYHGMTISNEIVTIRDRLDGSMGLNFKKKQKLWRTQKISSLENNNPDNVCSLNIDDILIEFYRMGRFKDIFVKAFDRQNGNILWQIELPTNGIYNPITEAKVFREKLIYNANFIEGEKNDARLVGKMVYLNSVNGKVLYDHKTLGRGEIIDEVLYYIGYDYALHKLDLISFEDEIVSKNFIKEAFGEEPRHLALYSMGKYENDLVSIVLSSDETINSRVIWTDVSTGELKHNLSLEGKEISLIKDKLEVAKRYPEYCHTSGQLSRYILYPATDEDYLFHIIDLKNKEMNTSVKDYGKYTFHSIYKAKGQTYLLLKYFPYGSEKTDYSQNVFVNLDMKNLRVKSAINTGMSAIILPYHITDNRIWSYTEANTSLDKASWVLLDNINLSEIEKNSNEIEIEPFVKEIQEYLGF